MNTEIEIIGIYRVDKVKGVHLIELGIATNHKNIDIGQFTQEQKGLDRLDWQSPWDEKFLDNSGIKITGDWISSPTDDSEFTRLVFFLHFVDFEKPLLTQFGEVKLKTTQEMPKRLSDIIQYEEP